MIQWIDEQTGIFLDNETQAHHVFNYMLKMIGRADTTIISSFAITDEWVRRIIRYREKLGYLELILDNTIASRNPWLTDFAAGNSNTLYLTQNHSKSIYMANSETSIVSFMSNNATNNKRFENGVLFRDHPACEIYIRKIENLKKQANRWII